MNRLLGFFLSCKKLRCLSFVLGLLIVMSVSARAFTVDPANFGAYIYLNSSHNIKAIYKEGTVEWSESILGQGSLIGSATTRGMVLPMANIDLALAGLEYGITGCARASIYYFWAVEQIGGDPYYGKIPVHITTAGSVSRTASGSVGLGYLYAKVSFGWDPWSYTNYEADLTGETGTESFNEEFTRKVYKDTQFIVGLLVQGGATNAFNGGTVNMSGYVDPIFVIDPTWDRAKDFKLVFSEGISPQPQPVPEPATLLLIASGLMGLAGLRKKFK